MTNTPYTLRPPQPDDIGRVTHRHDDLYWQEYNWDEHFENLIARIVTDSLHQLQSVKRALLDRRDERGDHRFRLRRTSQKKVAKLRLLLIKPKAHCLGLGNRLVEKCIQFAREIGYDKMTFWTYAILTTAVSCTASIASHS